MALPTVLEKLQYENEKNILIQGLPSSLEKQFVKLPFSKSVTPLLKSRKIDFAVVFSINKTQLRSILCEVVPALASGVNIWVSYPKPTAKIVSDLIRDNDWSCLGEYGYIIDTHVELDNVWMATRFTKADIEIKMQPSAMDGIKVKASKLSVVEN